jgi:hypothetical protein
MKHEVAFLLFLSSISFAAKPWVGLEATCSMLKAAEMQTSTINYTDSNRSNSWNSNRFVYDLSVSPYIALFAGNHFEIDPQLILGYSLTDINRLFLLGGGIRGCLFIFQRDIISSQLSTKISYQQYFLLDANANSTSYYKSLVPIEISFLFNLRLSSRFGLRFSLPFISCNFNNYRIGSSILTGDNHQGNSIYGYNTIKLYVFPNLTPSLGIFLKL